MLLEFAIDGAPTMSAVQGAEDPLKLNKAQRRRLKHGAGLRPRLVSIDAGCHYSGVGRSKFYDDFLPRLKTVRVGRRNLVDLELLDRLIDELAAE